MNETSPGVQVDGVYFAVPDAYGTTGPQIGTWKEAVRAARETIERHEYKGQTVRKDVDWYHPRRYFQEDDTLVVYSRAFVQMRITEPVQDRQLGQVRSGCDRVAFTWEVFQDGTVEARDA